MAQALNTPTVSFVNLKGGVGKTALTVNLALSLAEQHQKSVLLIDMDPQFNATQHLLTEDEIVKGLKRTVKDVLDRQPPSISVTSPKLPRVAKAKAKDKEPKSKEPKEPKEP